MRSTVALIYKENLKNNIQNLRLFIKPETKMCVAVKADGYGCGAVLAARTAVECGASYLAVATVEEGIEIRKAGLTCGILLLSLCSPEEMSDVVRYKLTPLAFDAEYIADLEQAAAVQNSILSVFLAVDTGMGRIGCLPEDAVQFAEKITSCSHLHMDGMCTHFAVSDSTKADDRKYTEKQFRLFTQARDAIRGRGINPGICSCSSSAAMLDRPEMQLDMVRPGIVVYGYYPDRINGEYLSKKGTPLQLKPVMALRSEVAAIRPFVSGKSVSYGRTWTAEEDTDIAVLPIGYADGLLRRFSPGLRVSINGKLYPVRGRICMDQCMVDIGKNNKNVKRWDKVFIFGPEESGALKTAQDIADDTNTISYEIMTSITKRVERVIV